MIETFGIAILLGLLFLIFFRPGKTPPLANRLVINRPGQYQITLAAKLNLAQPFIEAVAKRIGPVAEMTQSSIKLFFAVRDKHVVSHGADNYLLAIVCRNGMLYFQAEYPSKKANDNLDVLKAFAIDALLDFPASDDLSETLELNIVSAIQSVALKSGVSVSLLTE